MTRAAFKSLRSNFVLRFAILTQRLSGTSIIGETTSNLEPVHTARTATTVFNQRKSG